MKIFKFLFKTIVILTIVFGCSNNSDSTQEEDLAALTLLNNEIKELIATGTCAANSNCDYIAFGSKACGGPTSFLVFSTSIDVDLLKEKVASYNKLESDYNMKWNIISDCSVPSPPTNMECLEGKCIGIY